MLADLSLDGRLSAFFTGDETELMVGLTRLAEVGLAAPLTPAGAEACGAAVSTFLSFPQAANGRAPRMRTTANKPARMVVTP